MEAKKPKGWGARIFEDIGYPVIRDVLKLILPYVIVAAIVIGAGWWGLEKFVFGPARSVAEVAVSATKATSEAAVKTGEAIKGAAIATGEKIGETYEAGKNAAGNAIEATKDFSVDIYTKTKDVLNGDKMKTEEDTPSSPPPQAEEPEAKSCWHARVPFWSC